MAHRMSFLNNLKMAVYLATHAQVSKIHIPNPNLYLTKT